MSQKQLTAETITSLAKKLDEFSEVLTAEEQAVLLGLLGTASAAMEAGHAETEAGDMTTDRATLTLPENVQLPRLSETIKDTFRGIPGVSQPGGEVMDSVGVGWLCVSWSKDYNKMTQLGEQVINPGVVSRVQGMKTFR